MECRQYRSGNLGVYNYSGKKCAVLSPEGEVLWWDRTGFRAAVENAVRYYLPVSGGSVTWNRYKREVLL